MNPYVGPCYDLAMFQCVYTFSSLLVCSEQIAVIWVMLKTVFLLICTIRGQSTVVGCIVCIYSSSVGCLSMWLTCVGAIVGSHSGRGSLPGLWPPGQSEALGRAPPQCGSPLGRGSAAQSPVQTESPSRSRGGVARKWEEGVTQAVTRAFFELEWSVYDFQHQSYPSKLHDLHGCMCCSCECYV